MIIVAIIHLLPLSSVIGNERLSALYGISFDEPNIEILMRHLAMLFGLLGSFLLYAAFDKSLQLLAFLAGFVSVVSFMWLAWSVGSTMRR
ncbi:MAG: phosphopantetheine adenylyltransferase [Bacteroidota bacterium]